MSVLFSLFLYEDEQVNVGLLVESLVRVHLWIPVPLATKFRMGLGCPALGRLVSLISETRLADQAYAVTFTPPGVAPSVRSGDREGAPGCSKAGDTEFRW